MVIFGVCFVVKTDFCKQNKIHGRRDNNMMKIYGDGLLTKLGKQRANSCSNFIKTDQP